MFCANILFHNISFDPRSFFVGNMALTIGLPLSTVKQCLFFTFLHTQSQKGEKKIKKNLWQNNTVLYRAALLGP